MRRRLPHGGVKRAFDVAFAAMVLLGTAPVVAAAVLAIRIETPGPAFFRQRRMGLHGRSFELLKLRGMYIDARDRFPRLYDYSVVGADHRFHLGEDPRVTGVGRVLRRFSIDELPNFWNVLRGDMSVVGPRPEIPEMAHAYGSSLERILSVKPGVTNPAKAGGRDRLDFAETLELELDYIERRSFLLDLRVIARTAATVVRADGVH